MEREFFICDNPDVMQAARQELVSIGFDEQQIHILSQDEQALARRRLLPLHRLQRSNMLYSSAAGALIGLLLATLLLAVSWLSGVVTSIGWLPFVLTAVALAGLLTWEGGLWGLGQLHRHLRHFERQLRRGFHVLIIDYPPQQRAYIQALAEHHPQLAVAAITASH
ncbi:MAG TPA: hypothetical protein VIN71_06645 [Pseudomonadales bacterium]